MRFSHYSILSDELAGGGYILMNGISGALDFISPRLGEAIREAIWNEHPEEIDPLRHLDAAAVGELADRGHLTELTPNDEKQIVVRLAGLIADEIHGRSAFMIVPNLDCNYRCTYCFERPLQRTITSKNAEISHARHNVVMTREQAHAAFSAIRQIQATHHRPSGGQVILYGGEPLDAKNADVVREIVRVGNEAGFYFAAISNGHHLDCFLDLLGKGKIEQVQVSIDGPKEVHDTRRISLLRDSSFDAIVRNVQRGLLETNAQYQIRVHVDPSNFHQFEELIAQFQALGWTNHPNVVIYANTVYKKARSSGKVTVDIDVGSLSQRLAAIALQFTNVHTGAPDIHAARALGPAFAQGDRVQLKATYCAANTGNYIFAPDAKIYACWESVGKACSRIGAYDLDGTLTLDAPAVDKWFKRSIATLPNCQSCAYALVCGGGCAQYAEYNHGDMYREYCDDFQASFRSALRTTAERALSEAATNL